MCSDAVAIRVNGVGKSYQIYEKSSDRLKQFLWPRIRRMLGLAKKSYFYEYWALRDVSFELKRGETVGIVGRNGSGKSTLLQIICGTLHPSAGEVEVNGRVAALLELGSGFNPEFTGRENVYFNAGVLGLTRKETEARFADIEAFADIGIFIDQPVKTYSSGMLVRLAFAVIAHVDADILVIDEALAVGDAFFTQKCMRFLRTFMQTGTVLFVSHDTASVKNLCSRAIWLEKGAVVEQGNPKDICDLYLQAYYEAQQGKSSSTQMKRSLPGLGAPPQRDQRMDFINASNLRNDIELFRFDPAAQAFGQGGATVSEVTILDIDGAPLNWVVGGETVSLRIVIDCHSALSSPIVGFMVKDKLGQGLFGDNTSLTYTEYSLPCESGDQICTQFTFDMPRLPAGNYAITVAVADGNQSEHTQHHWVHDALVFTSTSSSVASGLLGIPMKSIQMGLLPVEGQTTPA